MTFGEPLWLWALLALPVLAAVEAWATRQDRSRTARLVSRALWPRVVRRPAEAWRLVRLALLLVCVSGIVLALARPQWGIIREKIEREGVDIVLLLDTSGSMATEDVAGSRLFLARNAILNLISRLEGDRFALVAFEGEAYPLVPLTLDADAIGLFLETIEPGIVPQPGSSLGRGLAKGLETFVDKDRTNKVMVLISDGEDLEGEVDDAVRRAKEAGVIVHTVGVGTERGQPVPDFDREGNRIGFKKDEDGSAVVSRLHTETLEAIARGTGGRFARISPTDTSLGSIAAATLSMEQKTLAREYSYRKRERFQLPLGLAVASLTLALLLPLPPLRVRRFWDRKAAVLIGVLAAAEPSSGASGGVNPPSAAVESLRSKNAVLMSLVSVRPESARAESSKVMDELLLRPTRRTSLGKKQYGQGNHEAALTAFEGAATSRPKDPRARFNLADGLYKNGRYDEAEPLYRALGGDPRSPLAGAARFNLGNTLFQKRDYPEAVKAYRGALELEPGSVEVRRNLELALRALKREEERRQQGKERQEQQSKDQQDQQRKDQEGRQDEKRRDSPQHRPKTEEEKERERFEKEAGMPKERAMQLLDALQQNEKAEQRRLLAAREKQRRRGKDW